MVSGKGKRRDILMLARRNYILCLKRGDRVAQCDDQRAVGSVRSIIINRFAIKKKQTDNVNNIRTSLGSQRVNNIK